MEWGVDGGNWVGDTSEMNPIRFSFWPYELAAFDKEKYLCQSAMRKSCFVLSCLVFILSCLIFILSCIYLIWSSSYQFDNIYFTLFGKFQVFLSGLHLILSVLHLISLGKKPDCFHCFRFSLEPCSFPLKDAGSLTDQWKQIRDLKIVKWTSKCGLRLAELARTDNEKERAFLPPVE
jgi:hypothetical protein